MPRHAFFSLRVLTSVICDVSGHIPAAGLKVCGVATRKLTGHLYDNVGYLIPSSTVLRFLKDIEARGEFRGVVGKGFSWSPLENPAMREWARRWSGPTSG